MHPVRRITGILAAAAVCSSAIASAGEPVAFDSQPGEVVIRIGDTPVATYAYDDSEITRPYFAHVKTPGGIQVTRNHPPIEGRDLADHGTFHPGIWLAFGDISGSDFWRNKAPVEQVKFVEAPSGGEGKGSFAVRNRYLDQLDNSKVVCEEIARYAIVTRPSGYFLLWDSTFSSDDEFYFGDQEEMGLGFRIATPIRAERKSEGDIPPGTGTIRDSEGRQNGDEIWGNTADWADYSGELKGHHVGISLFCHPDNFRPSWFHARDYGLLEANPFGRDAFGKGPKSRVVVEPGKKLRLRYGVYVHEGPAGSSPDLKRAYADYLELTRE